MQVRLSWVEPGGSGIVQQALVHAVCQMQSPTGMRDKDLEIHVSFNLAGLMQTGALQWITQLDLNMTLQPLRTAPPWFPVLHSSQACFQVMPTISAAYVL